MGDSNLKRKRITMKLKTPNPLFEKWLTEWRDKAKKENSKMQYCFTMALQSLKKYPLPLERGRDCKILKGFGDKLCLMLDNKLSKYRANGGMDLDNTVIGHFAMYEEANESKKKKKSKSSSPDPPSKSTKNRHSKEYSPMEGSGGYAILITLYTQSLDPTYVGFMTKQEIIKNGQHLSHTSFTKPDPGSRYTAWSSMKTLISKNLVMKSSNPAKFSLTEEGLVLARKLFDKGKNTNLDTEKCDLPVQTNSQSSKNVQNEVICLDSSDDDDDLTTSTNSKYNYYSGSPVDDKDSDSYKLNYNYSSTATSSSQSCTVTSGSWERECIRENTVQKPGLTLLGTEDVLESKVVGNKDEKKTFQNHPSTSSMASSSSQDECFILPPDSFNIVLYVDTCETSGGNAPIQDDPILSDLKKLEINYEVKKLQIGDYLWICRDKNSDKELVLPYIIERKRMDDFAKSIKDGRYHEQKFRLKRSGIQNIFYLIEKCGNSEYLGLPITTLYQAATNTAIHDEFTVTFTENIRHTARYLANFSNLMVKMFQSKTLVSCPKDNLVDIVLEDDLVSLMTFSEFNCSAVKNKPMKVSDLFVKMLLQINGMSVDKALAIVEKYPTPLLLKMAYDENPGMEGEKLLANIQYGENNRKIGPVLSKIMHQLFTLKSYN